MERQILAAELRTDYKRSTTRGLRRVGLIPATVYGKQISQSCDIKIKMIDLKRCLHTDAGENTVIELAIEGHEKPSFPVLMKEIQVDPVSRKVLHVDFHTISMDENVSATVPVHLVGEAIGVKSEGGNIEQIHSELSVLAKPDHIPNSIEIDVSNLHVGDVIRRGDIKLEDAEIEGPANDPIVLVRASHLAEEAAEGATEEGAAAETA
ncbi:MAG: 50S ribosomal protein L25 [Armatimonadota bacterium]